MPQPQPSQRWKIRQCATADLERILNTEFSGDVGSYIPTVIAPPHQHCKDWTIVGLLQIPPPPLNPEPQSYSGPLQVGPRLVVHSPDEGPLDEEGAGNDDGERTPLIQATEIARVEKPYKSHVHRRTH